MDQPRTRAEWEARAATLRYRTQAFVDGRILYNTSSDDKPERQDAAITAFDEAIQAANGYARAYFYRSPVNIERGRFSAFQGLNMSLRKKVRADKAVVGIMRRASPPFTPSHSAPSRNSSVAVSSYSAK